MSLAVLSLSITLGTQHFLPKQMPIVSIQLLSLPEQVARQTPGEGVTLPGFIIDIDEARHRSPSKIFKGKCCPIPNKRAK